MTTTVRFDPTKSTVLDHLSVSEAVETVYLQDSQSHQQNIDLLAEILFDQHHKPVQIYSA
jgi:hypothetical protein